MFAAARGRRPARTFDNARLAAVADKSLPHGAFSASRKPVRIVRAQAASLKNLAKLAAELAAGSARQRSLCGFQPASIRVRDYVRQAMGRLGFAEDPRAICMWCSTFDRMKFSSAMAMIFCA